MEKRSLACLPLGAGILLLLAGCSGKTTGASDINRQANGTYSAKLNAIGSCDKGSPSTPCTAFFQWREVGAEAWTKGPDMTVDRIVKDRPFSQTVRGLAPRTTYEYQVCGREFTQAKIVCVGPDGKPDSSQNFTTGAGGGKAAAGGSGRAAGKPAGHAGAGGGGGAAPPGASPAAGGGIAGQVPGGSGGGGGFPVVPVAIAAAVIVLVGGLAWWARREAYW